MLLSVVRHGQGKDLFLFNSGDLVDGTGLGGATSTDGEALLPIIQQVPVGAQSWRVIARV